MPVPALVPAARIGLAPALTRHARAVDLPRCLLPLAAPALLPPGKHKR